MMLTASPSPRLPSTAAWGHIVARVVALLVFVLPLVASPRSAAAANSAPGDDQHGLAVVGLGSSVDATWPLARALYADAALRPAALDEAHARVLVGEAPGDAAPADLRDLADTRAAIHGDDAASRRLLTSIALALHVKGVVVVESASPADPRPSARVFVTTQAAFDAVRYDPDPSAPVTWGTGVAALTWTSTVQAFHRGFADASPPSPPSPSAPVVSPLATHAVDAAADADRTKPANRAFYQSPWFWAAAGAALFAAGAVYFATRNDGPDNVQLQVQVPK